MLPLLDTVTRETHTAQSLHLLRANERAWVCMYCSTVTRGAGNYDYRICLLNEIADNADGGHLCKRCYHVARVIPHTLSDWIVLRHNHLAMLRLLELRQFGGKAVRRQGAE